jgi:hypothetical protein
MADRPIIFSAPMVRALLDGRKTQTRRVLGNSGPGRGRSNIFSAQIGWSDSYVLDPGNANWRERDTPYAPGDRLWVREAWRFDAEWDDCPPREFDGADAIHYEADGETRLHLWGNPFTPGRLRPPIHMPRWASRLTLLVTDVRVQRLQEISSADAIAEGCPPYANSATIDCDTPNPRDDFKRLWNGIHGPDAWDANPWVAAITFDVKHGNIDDLTGGGE